MVHDCYSTIMESVGHDIADLDNLPNSTVSLIQLKETVSPKISSSQNTDDHFMCFGCGLSIKDKYIYKVMGKSYHEACLRCSCCQSTLSTFTKCFTRHGNIYCEHDHQMLYGKRCRRCMSVLLPTDVVHRAHFVYYHAQCFSCASCHRPFNLGDEYHFFDGDVFCRADYQAICNFGTEASLEEGRSDGDQKTPKRPRTILNAQQRRQFKNAFEKSSKPSRKVREQLANETGLSVRVVQVWFQNQRAKIKKISKKDPDSSVDAFKHGTNSEGRSTEDIPTSDDEELNMESDDIDMTESANYADPIQKLYNMTSSQLYFPFNT